MSDDRPPRLSGWCSPTDQYHKDCKSSTCECSNDPANHGRNALFTRGLGVSVRYANDSRTAPRRCANTVDPKGLTHFDLTERG